jgi:hypothetical protein
MKSDAAISLMFPFQILDTFIDLSLFNLFKFCIVAVYHQYSFSIVAVYIYTDDILKIYCRYIHKVLNLKRSERELKELKIEN